MTDTPTSKTQCRFCLESEGEDEVMNPLVEPCACKGSAQYVHWNCLRRWVRANPDRNGRSCKVCTSEFQIELFAPLEVIPTESLSSLYLEHTSLISFLIQFLYILGHVKLGVETITTNRAAWVILHQVQVVTHVLYVASFISQWRIKNHLLYLTLLWHSNVPRLLIAHAGTLYFILERQNMWMCFATHMLLSRYWPEHLRILGQINIQVLKDR